MEALKFNFKKLTNSKNPTTILIVAGAAFGLLLLGAAMRKARKPFRVDMWE